MEICDEVEEEKEKKVLVPPLSKGQREGYGLTEVGMNLFLFGEKIVYCQPAAQPCEGEQHGYRHKAACVSLRRTTSKKYMKVGPS